MTSQPGRLKLATRLLVAGWCFFQASLALAEPQAFGPVAPDAPPACMAGFVHLSKPELETLYRRAAPGTVPVGYARGKAISCAGTALAGPMAFVLGTVWHGKDFDPCEGLLVNQWCGVRAVRARVSYGTSWLDGLPSIVMDYEGSSPVVWRHVRDEMREVSPGLYLGVMYTRRCAGPKFVRFFVLDARGDCH